ncbi:MAG: HAD hydrolase-like protein [Candidatus Bathyarchaeia archaeon]
MEEWSSFYKDENWQLYPDVPDAFNMVKKLGLKTVIVTSIAKFMYIKALKPILDNVDLLVDAFTFHCEKSNSKFYWETLKTLKMKPEQAVIIGDEEDVDILLPKRLGMRAIFLDRAGKVQKILFEVEPDAIANNLMEGVQIVENWIMHGR